MTITYQAPNFAYGLASDLPGSPGSLTFFYATDTGASYTWGGTAWELITGAGATGATGPTGATGATGATGSAASNIWNAGSVTALDANSLAINSDTIEAIGLKGRTGGTAAPAGYIGEVLESTTTGADDTCTISIAAPAVVTVSGGHGSLGIFPVVFFTTGALPTGLSSNTLYWATYINATTFHVSTTIANAVAGTYITTTGSQSGTQSAVFNSAVTGSTQDIAAVILTPGIWILYGGVVWIASSGTSTNSSIWLNTTSVTRPTVNLTAVDSLLNSNQTFGFNQAGCVLTLNVSSNTPVYLSGVLGGTSGWGVYGQIVALRVG